MLEVSFYSLEDGEDIRIGSIRWDGKKFIKFPSGPSFLDEVLKTPIGNIASRKILSPQKTPEEWLDALSSQYQSAYLRATESKKI